MRKIWVPQLVVIGMLVWALNPTNPYGYYILLRWVCFGVFGYLALQAFDQRRQGWVWILGITAGLYNPIVPVHMTREISVGDQYCHGFDRSSVDRLHHFNRRESQCYLVDCYRQ